jgi:2-methylcitrate dehydratase PrpD
VSHAPAAGADATQPRVTEQIARFVAETDVSSIPPETIHQGRRCLVDWLGVAIIGATEEGSRILSRVSSELATGGTATVLGQATRLSPPYAALVNGFQSHVLDYDSTYNPGRTTVHGNAPVWPAIFAAAEWRPGRATGRDALVAFIVGWEAQVRIALGAGRAHYDVGWHVTGTVGHFGAAAAVARLLGLPATGVVSALGTAGTQAAGLKQVYGSMGKAFHPGKAAMDGLLAAALAAEGFTSTDSIVEGRVGFWNVLSTGADAAPALDGLGERWELLDDGFKAYACGSLMHPTIDAIISLRREHGLGPDDVDRIEARVHPYLSWVMAKDAPRTGLDGKFSSFHCAAVALVDGAAGIGQFTDERVNAPDVVAVRERVRFEFDEGLPKNAASVTLRLRDGRVVTHTTAANKGTSANPMSDDELSAKFLDLASGVLGAPRSRRILDDLWRIDELPDLAPLVAACGLDGAAS